MAKAALSTPRPLGSETISGAQHYRAGIARRRPAIVSTAVVVLLVEKVVGVELQAQVLVDVIADHRPMGRVTLDRAGPGAGTDVILVASQVADAVAERPLAEVVGGPDTARTLRCA